jgi:hypothetical protein
VGIVSNNAKALQNVASADDFLNVAATETVPLFEHLEFEFLLKYDVFTPKQFTHPFSAALLAR